MTLLEVELVLVGSRAPLLVARAPLRDRLTLLRRSGRAAHRDAALLDDVARVGAAVCLALDAAARIALAVEPVRVALLARSHRLRALSEEPLEHATGRGGTASRRR